MGDCCFPLYRSYQFGDNDESEKKAENVRRTRKKERSLEQSFSLRDRMMEEEEKTIMQS
jgi:hypothetical protein